MKDKKFKAFIAILLVITIISSIFAINVFADDRITYGHAIDYLYDQWQKMDAGYQTYQDFYDNCRNMQQNLEPNPLSHVAYGSLYSTIYAAYSTWDGMTDISSKIKALFDDFMDKNKNTTDTPLEDLEGYGAMAIFRYKIAGWTTWCTCYARCEYIYVYNNGNFTLNGNIKTDDYYADGSVRNATGLQYLNKNINNEQFVAMYGDIRYEDGTSEQKQVPTDTQTTNNLDNMTDNEVAELIQQLIDKINALKPEPPPDLSSIDAILQAIYYKLEKLEKNQLTQEQLNEMLDNLIDKLNNSENKADYTEIINAINAVREQSVTNKDELKDSISEVKDQSVINKDELKEAITEVKDQSVTNKDELKDSIKEVKDQSVINKDELKDAISELKEQSITNKDELIEQSIINTEALKDLIKQLKPNIDNDLSYTEILKGELMQKFAFIEKFKFIINSFISSYSTSSNTSPVIQLNFGDTSSHWFLNAMGVFDIKFDSFNERHVNNIRWMLAAFIYVMYAINTYKKIPLIISQGGAS